MMPLDRQGGPPVCADESRLHPTGRDVADRESPDSVPDAGPGRSVLLIAENYPPDVGGVANAARRNAEGLAARGMEMHVFTLSSQVPAGLLESKREGALLVHRLGTLRERDDSLQLAADLLEHLWERFGFTIFHGFYALYAGFLAVWSGKLLGGRSVVSVRGNDLDRGLFQERAFAPLHWTLTQADAVACVSRDLAKKAQELTGRGDVRYTPNTVDADLFRPEPPDQALLEELFPRASPADGAPPVLGCVGELRFKKGLHILMEAFQRIHATRPARLLLVGGARRAERQFLRNYLECHPNLEPDVRLVEYVTDRQLLVRHYNLLDVCVFPSLWEGMPNSALEAMACERVVVASDAGGLKDLVRHGETGALISRHQLGDLADVLLEALDLSPAAREALGREARRYVQAHHAPETEVDRLVAIYRSLSSPKP